MNSAKNKTQINLASWGVLSVSGQNTVKFLQGQLTQDMHNLIVNKPVLSAYLTPKGRVIAVFFVIYKDPESIFLIMPKLMLPIMLEKLHKYAIFSKVKLVDVSDEYYVMGDATHARVSIESHSTNMADFLQDEVIWQLALINHGIPTIMPETSEVFTAHDLNLPELQAVSFKKGCYTGQEIVARMQYKAKLKQHLHLISLQQALPVNHIFVDSQDNEIGRVVNIAPEGDAFKALAWLRDGVLEAFLHKS